MKKMNLPNRLTLLRIILVPVIWILYLAIPSNWAVLDQTTGLGMRDILVLLVFAAASITDFLDGYIARKNHLITSFGKFLDPIADKMLVNSVLILMVYLHQANVVAVLLMISRDLIVDGLRFTAASQGKVVSAGWWGKVKTVLQMIAIPLLMLQNWPFAYIHIPLAQIMLWLATAASLYSGWLYFWKLKKYVLETM
jgi:CDP-diacylglycerol--glycerol-3-phosphate 3-phosphatidyltransferase